MSKETPSYDPMSLHESIDDTYQSPEVVELHEALKIINGEPTQPAVQKAITVERAAGDTINKLFGAPPS